MDIMRTIGDVPVLVDPQGAHTLFFSEDFLSDNNVAGRPLSQLDICRLLSRDKFLPVFLHWELIDKCNFKCPFCYIVSHSHNRVVRFASVRQHVEHLVTAGLLYCVLSGGEPTMHPDFVDIYTYLKRSGVIVEIYSNGTCLAPELLSLLAEYPPYKFEISIYALEQDRFREATQSSVDAKYVLDNVLRLKSLGINVICKTPVNLLTSTQIAVIQEWCKANGVRHYHSINVVDAYDNTGLSMYAAPLEAVARFSRENELAFIDTHGVSDVSETKSAYSCSAGTHGIHINSNFSLLPCSSFNGRILGYDIQTLGVVAALEALGSHIAYAKGHTISGCVGCNASIYCKTCPANCEEAELSEGIVRYATTAARCAAIRREHHAISFYARVKADSSVNTAATPI